MTGTQARLPNIHIAIPIKQCRKAAFVLAAALTQFGPEDPITLTVTPDDETYPSQQHVAELTQLLSELEAELGPIPHIELAAAGELTAESIDISIRAGASPAGDARAVLELASFGRRFGSSISFDFGRRPRGGFGLTRAEVLAARRHRDLYRDRAPQTPIAVAVVLWSPNFWGTVETFVLAAEARPDVQIDVVLLTSDNGTFRERSELENHLFLRSHGVTPRDESWLRQNLDRLDVVVAPDPYDASRPPGLRAQDIAARGIRLIYIPYATSPMSDAASVPLMNLPLQNLAWLMYVPNSDELNIYRSVLDVDGSHLRYVGGLKNERVLTSQVCKRQAESIREKLSTSTIVLWTPHWSTHADGFSTFALYMQPMLEFFVAHPERGLIVRPHPRLLIDLERSGGERHTRDFRALCEEQPNIYLDESWDHVPAMQSADALVSDLSSLIAEYLPQDRPIAYLKRNPNGQLLGDTGWLDKVIEVTDTSALISFLQAPTRPAGAGQQSYEIGSGARAVAGMVEDFYAEMTGTRPTRMDQKSA
jgi:hypothetical protein